MRRVVLSYETLPIAAELAIAGRGCTVRTNTSTVISSLWKWRTVGAEGFEEEFELSVAVDGSMRRQEAPPQFRGRRQFVFATFHGIETFIFDLVARRVSAVISEETAQDVDFWNTVLIPIVMGVMGPSLGLAPMHSACLEMGGRGMLVAGMSGAGKSTLATALAKEGMALVSDDWIYVGESDGRVRVHGLDVPVKLMPDTAEYFPELKEMQPGIALNGELAYEVDARETLGVQTSAVCEPECIVFLERTTGESRIEPLGKSAAKEFFVRSAELLPPELAEATEKRRRIIDAVADRDCWHFQYGGSPRQGAARLRKFFEETYDARSTYASAY